MKIDNLTGFPVLKKLQLDNNVISKVDNLGHLTTLEWLDLSFNNLTKIEGLSTLVNLTELTLAHNKITSVECLDTLKKLEVFSIGFNDLKNLENLMYLRPFKRLRMCNFSGNPLCSDPEYRSYVLAHLKHLTYLDFRLIDSAAVTAAREQYQDELLELEEKEEEEEAREAEEAKITERRGVLARANLVGADTLLDDMMNEDPEMPRLKLIDVLQDALPEFREQFESITEPFLELMLKRDAAKWAERETFDGLLKEQKEKSIDKAKTMLDAFEADKKVVLELMQTEKVPEIVEERLLALRDGLETLSDDLMELEMCSVDIFEALINEFESNVRVCFDASIEGLQSYFVNLRELESSFHSNVMAAATVQYDKYQNNELDASLSDEGRHLLQDKETLLNIINGSHDAHVFKMDNKEDDLTKRENDQYEEWMSSTKANENERNRARVSEIWGYVARNKAEIDDYLEEDV